MTDRFSSIPLPQLLEIILNQYKAKKSIFGIHEELFFNPSKHTELKSHRFEQLMETPIGVAAGPHTQLAQNIVAAWLTGARFIELKTVQTLDELEITKPCIDMQDEGYNCEWSQELKIEQSFEQYLDAWIIIHILRHKFSHGNTGDPGVIFNMSVGYDLQGILQENVQWFFNKMQDASQELSEKIKLTQSIYPSVKNLIINPCVSDNVTLSTMHGCPADEIEAIGNYLIEEKKLHTAIKLNPTLLGKERLYELLFHSGFETKVPEVAFEHDLKYKAALGIIRNLQKKANNEQVQFSVKLTNTLESQNNKEVFGANEEMMYMSGRALHPISVQLAAKLQNEFEGLLDLSFSGGADAFNVSELVNCGLTPVTICTDILKPGGYGRMHQYIENLSGIKKLTIKESLVKLNAYASEVQKLVAYKKVGFKDPSIKTARKLNYFDCIHAPCVDTCPTNQGIPDYLYYTSRGKFEKAAEIITQTNPFPHSTGMICDHLCQTKCTRINYDSPLLIREIKRFIAENYLNDSIQEKASQKQLTAAIVGAGPSGLSCAYFLAKAGIKVDVYESKSKAGGMISGAIPAFRLTDEAIEIDIQAIINLGVNIHYDCEVNKRTFEKLYRDSDFIYIGIGARKSKIPDLPEITAKGVLDPLDFLFNVKGKMPSGIGKQVVIIGGGNTAMDAARTAFRLVGENGKVTIVYRRTIKQMPADLGEIKAVLEEGIEIIELLAPISINTKNGKLHSLVCQRMKLGAKDDSGRARPIEIPGSEFEIEMDTLIPAIGQDIDIDFATTEELRTNKGSYQTQLLKVSIGGDAMRGASTAINAIGDGRRAAQEIIDQAGIEFDTRGISSRPNQEFRQLKIKKAKRIQAQKVAETAIGDRRNFNLVSTSLTEDEAKKEAARCLLCDEVCDICTTVCPNLAFHSYETEPANFLLQKIVSTKNGSEIVEGIIFEIKQKHQVLHIADWCNQCGNCNTFCPSEGAPYLEKPHLYLERERFEIERDGFYLENKMEIPSLLAYLEEKQCSLSLHSEFLLYENSRLKVRLDTTSLRIIDFEVIKKVTFEEDLKQAVLMKIILQAALDFYAIESTN